MAQAWDAFETKKARLDREGKVHDAPVPSLYSTTCFLHRCYPRASAAQRLSELDRSGPRAWRKSARCKKSSAHACYTGAGYTRVA
jgi:hypothetical protein